MEISPRFTGTKLKEFNMEVTARQTMNYAASVGDDNPFYLDDTRKGGIVAPPMFATAVSWQISRRIWDFIEAEDFPADVLMTQVHYTEHIQFHRPVAPGDKLTLKGKVAAILPHRAGTHVVIRYDAGDRNGEKVFTMHTGAMLRGVECGGGDGKDNLPEVPDTPGESETAWETEIRIHPLASYVYDGCADIFFPIHSSPRFAKGVGLPGIILQGTATLAHAAKEIVNRECGGDPNLLGEIFCRFTGMVLPGTDIRVILDSVRDAGEGRDLFFTVMNSEGKKAISGGYARVGSP